MTTNRARPKAAAIAAGEALAALTGAGIDGATGAVVGAVAADPFVRLAGLAWDELRGRREQGVAQLVRETAEHLDADPVAMIRAALADPEASRLLQDALQVAASTLQEQKIQALARALAAGLDDGTRVDEEAMVIRVLADLEPIHVRVMKWLADREHGLTRRELRIFVQDPFEDPNRGSNFDVSAALFAVLQTHGVLEEKPEEQVGLLSRALRRGQDETPRASDGPAYRLSSFGRFCYLHLDPTYEAPRRKKRRR